MEIVVTEMRDMYRIETANNNGNAGNLTTGGAG
jgi:hypothetical protein